MLRSALWLFVLLTLVGTVLAYEHSPATLWPIVLLLWPIALLGIYDVLQLEHSVLRNFPIVGHGRYLLERIRPEINQYFVESNTDGQPVNRELRSIVYQRAKRENDTLPFGTKADVYAPGYEWVNHSLAPRHVDPNTLRVTVGGPQCTQPYSLSVLNISAMSFGSLSHAAITALNGGAARGGFAHNTGEGGVSPYHLAPGGDLIWQIGTGYFGCRDEHGKFDLNKFTDVANKPSVKMIEIKLSQGAKPAHGGILPASKVTLELAQIRGVPMGKTVVSPPAHETFSNPLGLLEFVDTLRTHSGGKPVGFKLCLGKRREFLAICKAMLQSKIVPDFITVDGGEGGTGAAPLEFSNSIGAPLIEGLWFVHNALVGCGLRPQIRVLCSGRVFTGFDIVKRIALGADACMSARGMMFSLGCIQALRCNENVCPVGVATQNPRLIKGLHIPSKTDRVYSFHQQTVRAAAEILGAAGLSELDELRPWHILRRINPHTTKTYAELSESLAPGCLERGNIPATWQRAWEAAVPESFHARTARPPKEGRAVENSN